MLFKIAFFSILLGFLLSLSSGLFFLLKDDGENKKRVYNSLGVRVSLAILFIIVLTYGVLTGQIRSKASWSYAQPQSAQNPKAIEPTADQPSKEPRKDRSQEGQGPGLKKVD